MPFPLLIPIALLAAQAPVPLPEVPEPDGSRPVGKVPSVHAEPAPPAWLRAVSHQAAFVDCARYTYEAYAGPGDTWLVRYVMLPEGDEAFREIEQAFLYTADRGKKPKVLNVADVAYTLTEAQHKGVTYRLVDRRNLQKPQ